MRINKEDNSLGIRKINCYTYMAKACGEPIEFNTIAMCDGIAQGHQGMRYCLPHREIICDSIEAMVVGEGIFDPVNYLNIDNYKEQDKMINDIFTLLADKICVLHAKDFCNLTKEPIDEITSGSSVYALSINTQW